MAYSATIGATTVTGMLGTGGAISRLLLENNTAGANNDHNLYFGEVTMTDVR
jgi:hypothetical protein